MRAQYLSRCLLPGLLLVAAPDAHAGLDHELGYDADGNWLRSYQLDAEYGVIALELAGGLWFGDDTQIGRSFWQSIDASVISGAGATALKYATGRPRPDQGDNPNAWFKGTKYQSFPSGEVTLQASFVTPFIVNYVRDDPWIVALEVLPVCDAMARLKTQAHWQTDVIAGFALGTGVGYWTTTRGTPFSVQILPKGITVGFYKRF